MRRGQIVGCFAHEGGTTDNNKNVAAEAVVIMSAVHHRVDEIL